MVEQLDPSSCLPKNLSNASNYHFRHYYPKQAYRRNREQALASRPSQPVSQAKIDPAVQNMEAVPTDGLTEEKGLAEDIPRNVSVDSATSTSFSEDYTTMTENGEGIDFESRTPSNHSLGSEDLESVGSDAVINVTNDDNCCDEVGDEGTDGESEGRMKINLFLSETDMEQLDFQEPSASLKSPELQGQSQGPFFEDREFDFLKSEPVKRSTSLKTYKTPPGTPRRKKMVRFADALGLDLESVRHILCQESPPDIPTSALRDLRVSEPEPSFIATEGTKYLTACFSQPGSDASFPARVQGEKVSLENCVINDQDMTATGTVRVSNISYHKSVRIRYTVNNWLTSEDITANYVVNSNDGPTDRFSFTINVPKYFNVGSRLEFAVLYSAGGQNYWDNNRGCNYVIECYAKALPSHSQDNTWLHFL